MTAPSDHWHRVYTTTSPTAVSWYQPIAVRSLELIGAVAPDHRTAILDVGGGASTLVDGLMRLGYADVTVLDIAPPALAIARERLGADAARVHWIEGDILEVGLPEARWGVWHDRAAFHFLTDPGDRRRYLSQLGRGLLPGGHAIFATFAPEGPPRCSGREVQRWDAAALGEELGGEFVPVTSVLEAHTKPDGGVQQFCWSVFRRTAARG